MLAIFLSLSGVSSFGHASARPSQILLVSISHAASSSRDVELLHSDLERHNPGAVVTVVQHVWPGQLHEKPFQEIVGVFQEKLRAAVAEAGHFNLIALDLPGQAEAKTFVVANDDDLTFVILETN